MVVNKIKKLKYLNEEGIEWKKIKYRNMLHSNGTCEHSKKSLPFGLVNNNYNFLLNYMLHKIHHFFVVVLFLLLFVDHIMYIINIRCCKIAMIYFFYFLND